ncbi:hypothetical protein XPA_006325 [Xanthoria parietina]
MDAWRFFLTPETTTSIFFHPVSASRTPGPGQLPAAAIAANGDCHLASCAWPRESDSGSSLASMSRFRVFESLLVGVSNMAGEAEIAHLYLITPHSRTLLTPSTT